MPIISDPAIVRDLWENELPVIQVLRQGKPVKFKKGARFDRWATFEKDGDFILLDMIRKVLRKMFGPRNYRLLNVVEDHAKSNKFFTRIAQYYGLDEWVKCKPVTEKDWADILEVWVACHSAERQLYDKDDPLLELQKFVSQLLRLRYGRLEIYAYKPCLTHQISHPKVLFETRPIALGTDILLTETLAPNYNPDAGPRTVGYLATLSNRPREISVSAFAPVETELEERLQMEMNPNISTALIFL